RCTLFVEKRQLRIYGNRHVVFGAFFDGGVPESWTGRAEMPMPSTSNRSTRSRPLWTLAGSRAGACAERTRGGPLGIMVKTMSGPEARGPARSAQAAGDHAHLAGGGEPDRGRTDDAERHADREGDVVVARPVVQQAGDEGPRRTAADQRGHQQAEDRAELLAL